MLLGEKRAPECRAQCGSLSKGRCSGGDARHAAIASESNSPTEFCISTPYALSDDPKHVPLPTQLLLRSILVWHTSAQDVFGIAQGWERKDARTSRSVFWVHLEEDHEAHRHWGESVCGLHMVLEISLSASITLLPLYRAIALITTPNLLAENHSPFSRDCTGLRTASSWCAGAHLLLGEWLRGLFAAPSPIAR